MVVDSSSAWPAVDQGNIIVQIHTCVVKIKLMNNGCSNVHKVKGHPSLQKGGCHEVHDIEDLVKVGQVVKGCSYFAARSMAQDAELVFCPYNYIVNPVIRDAMEVDISGSIIIFDEAHNIEDIARDAGSIDLDEEVLLRKCRPTELGQLSLNDSMTYQPLFEMTQDILSWIGRRKNTLVKREFRNYFRCMLTQRCKYCGLAEQKILSSSFIWIILNLVFWLKRNCGRNLKYDDVAMCSPALSKKVWTGDKALKELEEANMSLQSFPILQECAKKDRIGIAAQSSEDLDADCLNIKSVDKKNDTTKKNSKVTKSSRCQQEVGSNENFIGEESARLTHPSVPVTKYNTLSTQTTEVVMLTDDKDASVCTEYIDLECDSEKELRWSATPSVAFSSVDLELTIVKETPDVSFRSPKTTPKFFSKDDYSSPSTNHRFIALPQQSSFQPSSVLNLHADSTNVMCSTAVATPKMEITSEETSIKPEAESPWSVNSSVWKRRKVIDLSLVGPLNEFNAPQIPDRFSLTSSVTTADPTHRTEDMNHSENGCCRTKSFQSSAPSCSDQSHVPSGRNMNEKLQIFCSRCKNPLGLPENDFSVMCTVISTSKVHLMSLKKNTSETVALSTSTVDVLVCDTSYLDQRLATTREGASGQGIWCKEDGCVFNSIFCPFCFDRENCLGVQVVATDGLNVKFQNKILLYVDQLEVKNFEAETKNFKGEKEEALSLHSDSSIAKNVAVCTFEKFAYVSPVQDSGGWRNTKSREFKFHDNLADETAKEGLDCFFTNWMQETSCECHTISYLQSHKMSTTMRSTQLYLWFSKLIFLWQPGFDAYLLTMLPAWNEIKLCHSAMETHFVVERQESPTCLCVRKCFPEGRLTGQI
ncbi:UNVERIFIED_CONTAM: Fanconi anemia group J protein [Sesamum indicum]